MKKKISSNKAVRRVTKRNVQRNTKSHSAGSLVFVVLMIFLVILLAAFLQRRVDHELVIYSVRDVLPIRIPSPTLYPAVKHAQTYSPVSAYELIAYGGMTRYLQRYEYPKEQDRMSLDGYTIDSISACSFITDSIQCNLEFSLKPRDAVSRNIGIENGRLSSDGWVLHKHGVLLLRLSADNLYEVWSIADNSPDLQ